MSDSTVALLVALLGSAGVGGVITSIVNGIIMARKGVSGREDRRKTDIIKQRDDAWARMKQAEAAERAAEDRADHERALRISWQEHAARLRFQLIAAGIEPAVRTLLKETPHDEHPPE